MRNFDPGGHSRRLLQYVYLSSGSDGNCSLRWDENYITGWDRVIPLWNRGRTRNYTATESDFNFLALPPCNTLHPAGLTFHPSLAKHMHQATFHKKLIVAEIVSKFPVYFGSCKSLSWSIETTDFCQQKNESSLHVNKLEFFLVLFHIYIFLSGCKAELSPKLFSNN